MSNNNKIHRTIKISLIPTQDMEENARHRVERAISITNNKKQSSILNRLPATKPNIKNPRHVPA
jgi:hypothetical protein